MAGGTSAMKIRNSKSETNSNLEMRKIEHSLPTFRTIQEAKVSEFRILNFGFVSSFEFRVSNFFLSANLLETPVAEQAVFLRPR
jgi:hypothetical protein